MIHPSTIEDRLSVDKGTNEEASKEEDKKKKEESVRTKTAWRRPPR